MHSSEEKNELLQRLDNAREGLIAALSGLSESQANFKPSPEAWSVAGIVEHLATVEDFVVMQEYRQAIALTTNAVEQVYLRRRIAEISSH